MSGKLTVWGVLCVISVQSLMHLAATTQSYADEAVGLGQGGFRIVTDVFLGEKKEPAQQTLTLFSAGVAYDISYDDPSQLAVIDFTRDRIVLLNKARSVKTSIDLKQLRQYIESARKEVSTSDLAGYLSGADKIDVADGIVKVGDAVLEYRATLQTPREAGMATQYAQAADALILLNGWRSGIAPFARLNLNRVVSEQNALPQEITRTASDGKASEVVRCRLHANWRLSRDDEQQIAEIGKLLAELPEVTAPEYFAKPPRTASK